MTTSQFVVVAATLEELRPLRPELEASLSPDEGRRAAAFVHPGAAEEFVLARGLLRKLLARELGIDPPEVRFSYGAKGKPMVERVQFNLSHAGSMIAVALGGRVELGIDIERVDAVNEDDDLPALARGHLSAQFGAALAALTDPGERRLHFLRAWTAMEASVKCLGLSLAKTTSSQPSRIRSEGFQAIPGGESDVTVSCLHFATEGYVGHVAFRNHSGSWGRISGEIAAIRLSEWISRY